MSFGFLSGQAWKEIKLSFSFPQTVKITVSIYGNRLCTAGMEEMCIRDRVRDGYLIGRGAQDNKGPAVAMLYVMRCIRDLKLDMKHEICLFVGCDEERGMADLEYYGSRYPFPALSMIADCGFPVCYGEKGILEGWAAADDSFSEDVIDLYGGSAGNIIPDRAVLVLRDRPELEELLSCLLYTS